jgi:predicted nucleic acid-binding protein
MHANEFDRLRELRHRALIDVIMPDTAWTRAATIQAELAISAQHNAPSVVDLLIAACAEHHGLTVLHYDADFDTITSVTGIPSEWVVPRGAADSSVPASKGIPHVGAAPSAGRP